MMMQMTIEDNMKRRLRAEGPGPDVMHNAMPPRKIQYEEEPLETLQPTRK